MLFSRVWSWPTVFCFLLGLFLVFTSQFTLASSSVFNQGDLRRQLGLTQLGQPKSLQDLKVAVLDNGFLGYKALSGQLPDSAEFVEGVVNGQLPTNHGLAMAQIVWAMTGKTSQGPKFYLINSNGFSNFKAAVQFVIDKKIDVVLYAQAWPFGSNFDGKGFINAQVTRALDSGTLWINAAGNHGGLTTQSKIQKNFDGKSNFLRLTSKEHSGNYIEFENDLDENNVEIVLSWSDFFESEVSSTSKNLDLYLYKEDETLVEKAIAIQDGVYLDGPAASANKMHSNYARESLLIRQLPKGKYRLRVRAESENFEAKDFFRIVLLNDKPGSIHLIDRTVGTEIFPPADHAGVITVGEAGPVSAEGVTTDGRSKPDVLINDAQIRFSNGTQTRGSSNASALFAGVQLLLMAHERDLGLQWNIVRLKRHLETLRGIGSTKGLRAISPYLIPASITFVTPVGGQVMQTIATSRWVVLTQESPLGLPQFSTVINAESSPDFNQVMALYDLNSGRAMFVPKGESLNYGPQWVEYRQRRQNAVNWMTPLLNGSTTP